MGTVGGAGVLALDGVGVLVVTLVLLLDLIWPAWLAATVVTVLRFVVAAVIALVGRNQVKQVVTLLIRRGRGPERLHQPVHAG